MKRTGKEVGIVGRMSSVEAVQRALLNDEQVDFSESENVLVFSR
jgi:hypothetical protein